MILLAVGERSFFGLQNWWLSVWSNANAAQVTQNVQHKRLQCLYIVAHVYLWDVLCAEQSCCAGHSLHSTAPHAMTLHSMPQNGPSQYGAPCGCMVQQSLSMFINSITSSSWLFWFHPVSFSSGTTKISLQEEDPSSEVPSAKYYLLIYVAFAAALMVANVARNIIAVWGSYRASRTMHARLLGHVLLLPMAFFDSQPLGRLLNRFTKDTEAVDVELLHLVCAVLCSMLCCDISCCAVLAVPCCAVPAVLCCAVSCCSIHVPIFLCAYPVIWCGADVPCHGILCCAVLYFCIPMHISTKIMVSHHASVGTDGLSSICTRCSSRTLVMAAVVKAAVPLHAVLC